MAIWASVRNLPNAIRSPVNAEMWPTNGNGKLTERVRQDPKKLGQSV